MPGVEVQPPRAVVPFTSTYRWSNHWTEGSVEGYDDRITVSTGDGWLFNVLDSSDSRYEGPLVLTMTEIEYPGEGSVAVGGGRLRGPHRRGAGDMVAGGGVEATVRFDGLVFEGHLWDAREPCVP